LLCRALVDQGRGRLDAARNALDRADQVVKKHWPEGNRTPDMGEWWVWAWAQALRTEAKALRKIGLAAQSP
jgi:hypothetical protein